MPQLSTIVLMNNTCNHTESFIKVYNSVDSVFIQQGVHGSDDTFVSPVPGNKLVDVKNLVLEPASCC